MAKKKPAKTSAAKPKRKKRALPSVEVEGFGKLVYVKSMSCWTGRVALPTLAAKIPSFRHGKDSAPFGWWRMPAGSFAVSVMDEHRQGPAPAQVEALQLLASKEPKIGREVLRIHAAAAKGAARAWDEHWRRMGLDVRARTARPPEPECTEVTVLDLQFKGVAYIDFGFHNDEIDDEHGSHVVYHPKAGTHWTSNAYETIDNGAAIYKAPEPGLNDKLAEALYMGHWKKADKLMAAGADINGFSGEVYPPLYYYAKQPDVKGVKRLLELGADPRKRGSERRSVLSEVRESLGDLRWFVKEEMRAAGPGPRPAQLVDKSVRSLIAKYEEIVELLEEHGAR